MRVCKQCSQRKVDDEFRIIKQKKKTKKPFTRHKKQTSVIRRDGKCKDCRRAFMREYMAKHRRTPTGQRGVLKDVLRKYGADMTVERYDELFAKQQGQCAICGDAPLRLNVDHCHASGRVRGLLCRQCNLALGSFRDNIKVLQAAISYLQV